MSHPYLIIHGELIVKTERDRGWRVPLLDIELGERAATAILDESIDMILRETKETLDT